MSKWDISTKKFVIRYTKAHSNGNCSMVKTTDDKYLFTSDLSGNIKQWCLHKFFVIKNFGKIHLNGVCCIIDTITNDNKYLLTTDGDGGIKQWDIKYQRLLKVYKSSYYNYRPQKLSIAVSH